MVSLGVELEKHGFLVFHFLVISLYNTLLILEFGDIDKKAISPLLCYNVRFNPYWFPILTINII